MNALLLLVGAFLLYTIAGRKKETTVETSVIHGRYYEIQANQKKTVFLVKMLDEDGVLLASFRIEGESVRQRTGVPELFEVFENDLPSIRKDIAEAFG